MKRKSGQKLGKRKKIGNRRIFTSPVTGNLIKKDKGFGFVRISSGEDIFVPAKYIKGAMNGDFVEIRPEKDKHQSGYRGRVIRIIERKHSIVCGIFDKDGDIGYIDPADKEFKDYLVVPKKFFSGAKPGDFVEGEILQYPDSHRPARGKILRIISKGNDPIGGIKALLAQRNIYPEFPAGVLEECRHVTGNSIEEEELKRRRDLRDRTIFTIDGDDTKDFDDAVSLEISKEGLFYLGVHIADVSHYVKENSLLDGEAIKRGTSIYLPHKVIPMLPKKLSEGMCSLNPGEDRLTLSLEIVLDKKGNIRGYEIYESVIKSKARLTYRRVSALLKGRVTEREFIYDETERSDENICKSLFNMKNLYEILALKRSERGTIDFDLDERSIEIGEDGVPTSINVRERTLAHKMIEEFMILANRVVAEHYFKRKLPFVYRVHSPPEREKFIELKEFLRELSLGGLLPASPKDVKPANIRKILETVKGEDLEETVNTYILRTMSKAEYSYECNGHFGLALPYYCHFTSPIRRYADLLIHSIIKEDINGRKFTGRETKFLNLRCKEGAFAASEKEKEAMELERLVEQMLCAVYMEKFLYCNFKGRICGINGYSMFIKLDNTVEGMVELESMQGDQYSFDRERNLVSGRKTGRTFKLGQEVEVCVLEADPYDGSIWFLLDKALS